MTFRALSRLNAELYSKSVNKDSSIIISIRCPEDVLPDIQCTEYNRIQDVLFLEFDDVEVDKIYKDPNSLKSYTLKCMSESQANEIVEFIDNYKSADVIIIHCDAGASRSVGVCAALEKYFNGDDTIYFQRYSPNMLCYRRVLEALYEVKGENNYE